MNCSAHSDVAAVGICGACGRGLCRECVAEIQRKLVCRGRCEERGRLLLEAEDKSLDTLRKSQRLIYAARKINLGAAALLAFAGLCFIAFGHAKWTMFWFVALLGYGFLGFAVLLAIAASRMPKAGDNRDA